MQEEQNNSHRWLLPFTRNLDLPAIDAALCMARSGRATLVAVSLTTTLRVPQTLDADQELIQHRSDSLGVFRARALHLAVPLERYEEYTREVPERIAAITRELHCNGILLGSCARHALFLTDDELRTLLLCPPTSLVLVRLPQKTTSQTRYGHREQKSTRLPWRTILARQADGLRASVSPARRMGTPKAERVTRTE